MASINVKKYDNTITLTRVDSKGYGILFSFFKERYSIFQTTRSYKRKISLFKLFFLKPVSFNLINDMRINYWNAVMIPVIYNMD